MKTKATVVMLMVSSLFYCETVHGQESSDVVDIVRAVVVEAAKIQDFESDGSSQDIIILREHSRQDPWDRDRPEGHWSDTALAHVQSSRAGNRVRVCQEQCLPTDGSWLMRLSYPELAGRDGTVVMELITPDWRNTYLIQLKRTNKEWAVSETAVIKFTNTRRAPPLRDDE